MSLNIKSASLDEVTRSHRRLNYFSAYIYEDDVKNIINENSLGIFVVNI